MCILYEYNIKATFLKALLFLAPDPSQTIDTIRNHVTHHIFSPYLITSIPLPKRYGVTLHLLLTLYCELVHFITHPSQLSYLLSIPMNSIKKGSCISSVSLEESNFCLCVEEKDRRKFWLQYGRVYCVLQGRVAFQV